MNSQVKKKDVFVNSYLRTHVIDMVVKLFSFVVYGSGIALMSTFNGQMHIHLKELSIECICISLKSLQNTLKKETIFCLLCISVFHRSHI